MISIDKLKQAAKEGLIDEQNISSLHEFLNARDSYAGEDNSLAFLNSYSDFFIALGIALLFFATLLAGRSEYESTINIVSFVILFGLGHWLIKIQKLRLSGIAINIFLYVIILSVIAPKSPFEINHVVFSEVFEAGVVSFALFGVFMYFRVPFGLMLFAVSCLHALSLLLISLNLLSPDTIFTLGAVLGLFFGLFLFFIAVVIDSKDVSRKKKTSDYAFWLHSTASPVIMASIGAGLNSIFLDNYLMISLLIYLVTLIFIFVALYVDRRALLSSSIILLIVVSVDMFGERYQLETDIGLLIISAILGLLIIILGGFWYSVRNKVFGKLNLPLNKYVPSFNL